MRPDLKVVSAAIPYTLFEDLERVCAELNMHRSDVLRRAITEFIAIHDYKLFIASLEQDTLTEIFKDVRRYINTIIPDGIDDITHSERISQAYEYKMTCEKQGDQPNGE